MDYIAHSCNNKKQPGTGWIFPFPVAEAGVSNYGQVLQGIFNPGYQYVAPMELKPGAGWIFPFPVAEAGISNYGQVLRGIINPGFAPWATNMSLLWS
ncbi:MAG TPA: hypothetical protein DER09_03735 [Prolixibacteraceae bacterium]|nr:hypothetical protein [Prolixibacteraceae bacterium]